MLLDGGVILLLLDGNNRGFARMRWLFPSLYIHCCKIEKIYLVDLSREKMFFREQRES